MNHTDKPDPGVWVVDPQGTPTKVGSKSDAAVLARYRAEGYRIATDADFAPMLVVNGGGRLVMVSPLSLAATRARIGWIDDQGRRWRVANDADRAEWEARMADEAARAAAMREADREAAAAARNLRAALAGGQAR